ncbi:MAG: hypothetical protein HY578_08200 [Nitrospinae bacterium]|nr:hypothetical protein [Nitrospinota bacterium]
MNTQNHAIVNLFIIRKLGGTRIAKDRGVNISIVTGSILPDIPIIIFFAWNTWIVPSPQDTIWRILYFQNNWQWFFNIFNSIPLFLIIAGISYYLSRTGLLIFCLANLLHFVEDFFLHMEDAHAHFFPLSNYKFISPISYWDPRGFGIYLSIVESVITLIISLFVFKYLQFRWGKVLLIIANIFSFGSHVMWYFIFLNL